MKELLASIQRNAIGLGLFAIVTAGAIAIAQVGTADRIAHNMRLAQSRALNEIIPANQYDNDLLTDVISVNRNFDTRLLGPLPDDASIHLARHQGQVTTVILPVVAPDGYTMEIGLLVGIHADGRLAGVRVISHRETPGLGDKIDLKKSDWVMAFNGKSLLSPAESAWAVKKDGGDFDQFTGATITPRAVVTAVKHALQFFERHQTQLLSYPLPASASRVENH
ncbi:MULTISPECIES: electron transport complex subunit RsxG [unclassified Oceanobacter]|uniref:electron transport complex subunit RsxG n=1 Tax=unclassified Oceanobacter TaxID=2620260 RepID=UPI0026E4468F|nr:MULTISPECIES: electron transport complex subunit RsxG [unclassified Oceanobacter]MDO6683479.1 electron transport complex subunit RsxG [Oceanobacter sp. 5_MG-2023]MDP2548444.1 electron transport complex subunit RsxG [Oceanobacter sp. 4_MG-2023]